MKVSVIIVYKSAYSKFLKGACLYSSSNEVLVADYDTRFNYFFSATSSEPIYVVLVVVVSPFLQNVTDNLRGGPRGKPFFYPESLRQYGRLLSNQRSMLNDVTSNTCVCLHFGLGRTRGKMGVTPTTTARRKS